MSTPSRQIIGNLINILNGSAPPPVTRFLSFSGELTPQQVQALADAIQGTSVQLGFRLKGCLLGDSGAEIVASALANNHTIHTLELLGNGIGLSGAQALAACFKTNTTLTSLDLADNPCELEAPEVLEAIDQALERNRVPTSSNSPNHENHSPNPPNLSTSSLSQPISLQDQSPGAQDQPSVLEDQPLGHQDQPLGPQHQPLEPLNQSPGRPSVAPASHRCVPPLSLSSLGHSKSARDGVLPSGKENRAVSARTSGSHTSRTSPVGADDFESRILYLESASDNISREVARMRGDLTQVGEWEHRVDTLSNEVAAVFASVQSEQNDFRTLFEEWAVWQQKSEAGSQRFAGEVASLGGDLDSLHQHVGQMGVSLEDRAALVAYNEAQEVWDRCSAELEEVHIQVQNVWQAHVQLVSATVAGEGIPGQEVGLRLEALEENMEQALGKTEQLDGHINKMLTKLIEFGNQEQLRLKHDHEELKDHVTEAEHQDRVASRTCQDQVAKLGSGQQKLQQDTAAMAEALADLIRRKSPSMLWQVSHEAAVKEVEGRVDRLDKGLADANSYAETEAVRSAQTEAVLDSLLHFKADTEARLGPASASPGFVPAQQGLPLGEEGVAPQGEGVAPQGEDDSQRQVANPQQQQQREVDVLRDQTNQQQLAVSQTLNEQSKAAPEGLVAGARPDGLPEDDAVPQVGPPVSPSQMAAELQALKEAHAVELRLQKEATAALQQQVQSQQTVINSMQGQLNAVLNQLGNVADTHSDGVHDAASDAQPTGTSDRVHASAQTHNLRPDPSCSGAPDVSGVDPAMSSHADAHAASHSPDGSRDPQSVEDDDQTTSASDDCTSCCSVAGVSSQESKVDKRPLILADDHGKAAVHHHQANNKVLPFRFFRTINAPYRFL